MKIVKEMTWSRNGMIQKTDGEIKREEKKQMKTLDQTEERKKHMEQGNNNTETVVFDELEAERAAGVYEKDEGMQEADAEENEAEFHKNNRGMGTVEIILIIVVLVGLVLIFKNQITQIVNSLFGKITQQTGGI